MKKDQEIAKTMYYICTMIENPGVGGTAPLLLAADAHAWNLISLSSSFSLKSFPGIVKYD